MSDRHPRRNIHMHMTHCSSLHRLYPGIGRGTGVRGELAPLAVRTRWGQKRYSGPVGTRIECRRQCWCTPSSRPRPAAGRGRRTSDIPCGRCYARTSCFGAGSLADVAEVVGACEFGACFIPVVGEMPIASARMLGRISRTNCCQVPVRLAAREPWWRSSSARWLALMCSPGKQPANGQESCCAAVCRKSFSTGSGPS